LRKTGTVTSPDGKKLVSASADGTLMLWNLDFNVWQTEACEIVGRNLTPAEWEDYLPDAPYRRTCAQWPEGR